ncbi:hypothetical protein TEA_015698 [Camellia sinensis var. sinensis]|uniref:DNA helicase n=1 Tax=Camellia sinensis var. sinensis TaxID=542762 RepID=A0A4S4D6R3_CAMSN|nr:hypothetical protein TEA_015698 [Camellia sinensis var. sinensis]
MELDPDDVFRDEDDDPDNDFYQEREASKDLVVYLVDASPKMFQLTSLQENQEEETHFHVAVSCIAQALKTQIINRSYDEVAICFFNTREKKNLQDLNGVYVFNVAEREDLDRPTARLIKEFDCIEGLILEIYAESFTKEIGSQYGILSGSRDNSLYNALWVAQALLRKGSAKTADKRILMFANEDDPFGSMKGITKIDMTRTTLQRAKDAQDLGISIELLPLSKPDVEFNDLLGLEGDDLTQFLPSVGERHLLLEIIRGLWIGQLGSRVCQGCLAVSQGKTIPPLLILERDDVDLTLTHMPYHDTLSETERSFLCADTGALLQEPAKRFHAYKNENIKFSVEELSEIKRVSTGQLCLLGFKPLTCLKDYHNLRPSTFVFPSDEEVIGSTCIFIALHRSMLRLKRFAVAFYGSSTRPQLVALVAQLHSDVNSMIPRATDDQINKATALMKRIDLKDFSVCQFANPALQRHYAVLQALALDEDEMPEIKDETAPDEEGLARPGVVNALEEFKNTIFGENYDDGNEFETNGKVSEASRKRKAIAENAAKECASYDWSDLADNGKLKDLTVVELKYYLSAHNLPLAGKKEALINRILVHMGK